MASMQPEFTAAFYLLEVAKRSLWLEELRETVQTPRPCCAKREGIEIHDRNANFPERLSIALNPASLTLDEALAKTRADDRPD